MPVPEEHSAEASRLRVIRAHELLAELELPDALSVGRLPDNDLVLEDDHVSGHHGRLERSHRGWRYTDVGSTNGSIVAAGPTLRAGESFDFAEDTQILLGATVLDVRVARVPRQTSPPGRSAGTPRLPRVPARLYLPTPTGSPGTPPSAWVARALPGPRATLGRADDCEAVVRHPSVSARHAELVSLDGGWQLRDLGSASGTRVGVRRLRGVERLAGDCQVLLGDAELLFSDRVASLPEVARLLAALVADERLSRAQARVARQELRLRADTPDAGDLRDFLLGRGWLSPGAWVETLERAGRGPGGPPPARRRRLAALAVLLVVLAAVLAYLLARQRGGAGSG